MLEDVCFDIFCYRFHQLSMCLSNLEILARYQCLLRNSFRCHLTLHFVLSQACNQWHRQDLLRGGAKWKRCRGALTVDLGTGAAAAR